MKGNKRYLLIIFIFSIFIILVGSFEGYIKGHDTDFHLSNISAILNKLSIENSLVQEPLDFLAGDFGYGTRFFYPPVPHMIASYFTKALTLLNIDSIAIGMRMTQWVCFLASGITFFYLSKKIFKNEKIAMILSLLYMAAPYHLMEVFVRDAFSEMFIPIAIPLIVLGLFYLIEKEYKYFYICFIRRVYISYIFTSCNEYILYINDFGYIFYNIF